MMAVKTGDRMVAGRCFFSGGVKMYISKNPAKSRPLSANVKRLMRLARSAPANGNVVREARHFTAKDLACCAKQGDLFMEASSMGFTMDEFAPLFMTSQLAGVIDASFSSSAVMDNENLSNLLQIPVLLKSPELIVESLFWIDEIISKTEEGTNKSLALTEAYKAEKLKLPQALADLPPEQNRNIDDLAYAYWLGFIYRCECLLHEESSRMVYGAFDEKIMHAAYDRLIKSPLAEENLVDIAETICADLDRLLVEKIWPAEKKAQQKRQEAELKRQ